VSTERLLVLVVLAAVVAVAVVVGRLLAGRRLAQLREAPADRFWSALGARPDGRPAVVAFSTASCAACHSAQSPAIEALRLRLGDGLRVFHVDAGQNPVAAKVFGVMTVPTTVVLKPEGVVAAVNNGFAPTEQLARQLSFA